MRKRLVALSCSGLLLACGEPPPPAPSAVIRTCPTAVCLGDDFATNIHLDATKSAPRLTLVTDPDADPSKLDFQWSFSGAKMLFDLGDESQADVVIAMAGDRPLHVELRVENEVGGVSTALETVAVTPLDDTGSCPLPKPEDDTSDDCVSIGAAKQ